MEIQYFETDFPSKYRKLRLTFQNPKCIQNTFTLESMTLNSTI